MSESSQVEGGQGAGEAVSKLQTELEAARSALAESERRRSLERELVRQRAIDLEAALLLTEASVSQMSDVDAARAVADLRRSKPYLFEAARPQAGVMGASPDERGSAAESAAQEARGTGDRKALLRYLRMKRLGK